jgi:hypothetical protein
MNSQNSFYECINKLTDLNNYIKDFTHNHLITHAEDPKLKLLPLKIKEFNNYLATNMHEDLHQLKWVIHILDREQDKEILKQAYQALNTLVNGLNLTSSRLYDVQCLLKHTELSVHSPLIDQCLETITKICSPQEILNNVAETTHNLLKTVYNVENEEMIDLTASTVKDPEDVSTQSNRIDATSKSKYKLLFSEYKPKLLIIHEFQSQNDNELTKQDVREMMQGVNLQTQPSYFVSPNKYGIYVEVPHLFCVDLPRSDLLMLNNTCLFNAQKSDEFNLNDAALVLYRTFGKSPAIRIMNLCHQSAVSFMCTYYIFPLIQEGGAYRKKIPLKGNLICTNDEKDGLIHQININDKTNRVEISSKMKLMVKSDDEDNTGMNVYLVVKRTISLSLDELKAMDFETSLHPAPSLTVKDFITEPILDDPKFVDTILQNL